MSDRILVSPEVKDTALFSPQLQLSPQDDKEQDVGPGKEHLKPCTQNCITPNSCSIVLITLSGVPFNNCLKAKVTALKRVFHNVG